MQETSPSNNPGAAIQNERVLSAGPREIFAAFEHPDRLARWWGPKGFTNTFEHFEFKQDGRWTFVMHGPDGSDYPSENVFRVIRPHTEIVIEHVDAPWFRLSITLTAQGDRTHLVWHQEFESAEFAAKMRPICQPANEQNLDRLEAVLASVR